MPGALALGSGEVTGLVAWKEVDAPGDGWEREVVPGAGLALDSRGVGANHDSVTVTFPELLSLSEPVSAPCRRASPCAGSEGNPQSPRRKEVQGRKRADSHAEVPG